jgi:futalosine hydrolase
MSSAGRLTLILLPTAMEAEWIERSGGLGGGLGLLETIGFGPIAAAASTAALLERLRPRRALLLGIAGSYDEARLPLGTACTFERAAIDGIGAGEGERFVPATRMPFASDAQPPAARSDPEGIALARPAIERASTSGLLLSVCAASGDAEQAARRKRLHPRAVAEDMEAFGVAYACARADVPLCVVRGISNVAGDRDSKRWSFREALSSARTLALEILESSAAWEIDSESARTQASQRPQLGGRA